MGDSNALSSLYPQPVAPPQNNALLSDPSKILGIVGQLNQNALFSQQLNARKAIGQVYQNAIQPDGSINTRALMQGIKENPDAGFMAGEASQGALARQGQALTNTGQAISNTTAQFDQKAKMQQFAANSFSMIDPEKPTKEQVLNWSVMMKRNFPNMPSAMINGMAETALNDPQGLAHGVGVMKNMALGAGGTSERMEGPPDATGSATTISKGQANLTPGGIVKSLPPGSGDYLAASAKAGTDLEATARTYPQDVADLSNLVQEGKILSNKTGPTFEAEKKINTVLNRFGIQGTMSHDELAAGDSFDKIAKQITTNQAAALGGGTDAGRAMILGATPNTSMSQYGIEGVGQMMLGNRDAINTARQEWIKAKKAGNLPQNAHLDWLNDFTQDFDPRVFQFNRMSRDNQQKFLHNMDPADVQDFDRKYRDAIDKKWVKPLKKNDNG